MKRFAIVLLATLLALSSLPAMASGIPNPMRSATSDEIQELLGAPLRLPMGATGAAYFLYEMPGAEPMAEVQFFLSYISYSYRAQKADAAANISGVFKTFETQQDIPLTSDIQATLRFNEGLDGICIWYDAPSALNYSLSMQEDASADRLTATAKSVFGL